MRYPHVLVCEANESDREVFSETLANCYVEHCGRLEELSDLLNDSEYDAIFLGRSSIIEFLDGEISVINKLADYETDCLFMFRVSDDLSIQVKRVSIL